MLLLEMKKSKSNKRNTNPLAKFGEEGSLLDPSLAAPWLEKRASFFSFLESSSEVDATTFNALLQGVGMHYPQKLLQGGVDHL